jgi:hypothetical protein
MTTGRISQTILEMMAKKVVPLLDVAKPLPSGGKERRSVRSRKCKIQLRRASLAIMVGMAGAKERWIWSA